MKLESKPAANLVLYLVAIAIGLLLMWLARDFTNSDTNVKAGFLLGCMVFGLGAIALGVGESRCIELDEQRKMIVLNIKRRIGGSRHVEIPFYDIKEFSIGVMGDRSNGSIYYDLVVKVRNGKEIHLFGGCVFEGRMSRAWIEKLRSSFEAAALAGC